MRDGSTACQRVRPTSRCGQPVGALLLLLTAATACSDLTKVQAPDVVQRPGLTNANGAITFFNGAVRQFYATFGGSVINAGPYVMSSGLYGDELIGAISTGVYLVDARRIPEGSSVTGLDAYTASQTSRLAQLQALSLLKPLVPNERWRTGQMYGFMGYLETFLAEMFCSGVPLSSIGSDFAPRLGAPLTSTQLYQQALADFDSAAAYATDSARILNMALLGRGRVLLDMNQPAQAALAVASVPTSFVFATEHTLAVQPNGVSTAFTTGSITVADRKGGNGLNYATANDPRVPVVLVRTGGDGVTPVLRLGRISAQTSPNVLTNGIEARLIEAEAALRAGDVSGWLSKLNGLRATAISPAMAALTDPGSTDARVDLLFRERAFWLFLTGHRLGDMRRLLRQYGRTQATVYPVGPYKYGGSFEDAVQSPIDWNEAINNPLLHGKQCLDRNP